MSSSEDVYVAVYEYAAQTSEELSIQEGTLLILNKTQEDPDWALVTLRSPDAFVEQQSGLVPRTYIEPVGIDCPHIWSQKMQEEKNS
jgi:hypothetical protein